MEVNPTLTGRSEGLAAFDYHPRTRLVFGASTIERLGELVRSLGGRKVLVVTDPGLVAAGHLARVETLLSAEGIHAAVFSEVIENPTTRCVDRCVEAAKQSGIDTLIGLGGGSSMDTAKGCNFLLTNGGAMRDYWGVGKAARPMLPLIAIPTTAGTGSECQSAALIADEVTHQKMACLDPKAAARVALLDPLLTVSQPTRVTACTGIDAIAHAVETAVTRKRNPLSWVFSREAFRLCSPALPRVMAEPEDIAARGAMLLGAAYAGCAIENSMLGAAHAAANPLTARFDVVHGTAVGLMLPGVVRFNALDPECAAVYAELAVAAGIADAGITPESAAEALACHLETLLDVAAMPKSLAECGADEKSIPALADEALKQWTAGFNPRSPTHADFVALYESAFVSRPTSG